MKVLAVELSSARGSLAWMSEGKTIERNWPNDRRNSGLFFENLLALRTRFGLPDTIVVGLGPGSYAGVRIAISAAIGLQALSNKRLLGYPSICAMETDEKQYCVIGDARRRSYFFAMIRAHKLLEGPVLLAEKELRDKLDRVERRTPVFAAEHLPQFSDVNISYPSASVLGRLVRESDCVFLEPPLQPMYLRDAYITMP
jgi:tRNA threonylcarbamoyladenosine biosynthesis protein TsaB